jgi:hypothetical protein
MVCDMGFLLLKLLTEQKTSAFRSAEVFEKYLENMTISRLNFQESRLNKKIGQKSHKDRLSGQS